MRLFFGAPGGGIAIDRSSIGSAGSGLVDRWQKLSIPWLWTTLLLLVVNASCTSVEAERTGADSEEAPIDTSESAYRWPRERIDDRVAGWTKVRASEASPFILAQLIVGELPDGLECRRTSWEQYRRWGTPDSVWVQVTARLCMDDSQSSVRYEVQLRSDNDGVWYVLSVEESWACHEGRGHTNFSAEPCL